MTSIKNFILILYICAVALILGSVLTNSFSADESALTQFLLANPLNVTSVWEQTGKPKAKFSVQVSRIHKGGVNPTYHLEVNGEGSFDKYKDVTWFSEANLRENQGYLENLFTKTSIRDRQGHILTIYVKHYDPLVGQITFRVIDGERNILEEFFFPMKGKTFDDVTSVFCLAPFLNQPANSPDSYFFLLNNEPRLLRIRLSIIGPEILHLGQKDISAIKVRLIPENGFWDSLLNRFVNPTYVWYRQDPPHEWLQYQGFDKNLTSPFIRSFIQHSGSPP
jgi:hypothetical protein